MTSGMIIRTVDPKKRSFRKKRWLLIWIAPKELTIKNHPSPVVFRTFSSYVVEVLHHFSYKTTSHNCSIFVLRRKERDYHPVRAQGTLNECCSKESTPGRGKEQKSYRKASDPEGLMSRCFCGHQITIHSSVVLGQRIQLKETASQPLAPGDINHSYQDTQLAQKGFQHFTGSKNASKKVFLM